MSAKCPLCGGKVVYEGMSALECETVGCENCPPKPPSAHTATGVNWGEMSEEAIRQWLQMYGMFMRSAGRTHRFAQTHDEIVIDVAEAEVEAFAHHFYSALSRAWLGHSD